MSEYRTCLGCKHFDFYEGFGGTDVTPGDSPEITCFKDVWRFHFYRDTDLKETLETANRCEHYEFEAKRGR